MLIYGNDAFCEQKNESHVPRKRGLNYSTSLMTQKKVSSCVFLFLPLLLSCLGYDWSEARPVLWPVQERPPPFLSKVPGGARWSGKNGRFWSKKRSWGEHSAPKTKNKMVKSQAIWPLTQKRKKKKKHRPLGPKSQSEEADTDPSATSWRKQLLF